MLRKVKILFLGLWQLLSIHNVNSQYLPTRLFSTNDGLPSSEVYSIIQDSKHRFWICTDNGVSFFNGSNFVNYTIENGLPTNTVFSCVENRMDGKVWFITYGFGLCYFNERTNRFVQPAFNKQLIKIFNKKFINTCAFDLLGNMWITYDYHGCLKIDRHGKITILLPGGSFESGGFEIITGNGLNLIRNIYGVKSAKNVQYQAFFTENRILIKGNISSNYSNSKLVQLNDSLWVLAFANELVYLHKNGTIRVVKMPQDILSIFKDNEQNLWVGLLKGGIRIIYHNNHYQSKTDQINQFNELSVSSIFQDHYGKIWFTTLSNGLYCLPNTGIKNYILQNKVSGIFQDGDYLSLITLTGGRFNNFGKGYSFVAQANSAEIKDISRGPDQRIYVCRAIYNQVIPQVIDKENINANSIAFFEKSFYVGGKTVLIKYNYEHLLEKVFNVPSPILKLKKLNNSTLLVGCLNGLYLFNNEKFKRLNHPGWLAETRINSIFTHGDQVFILTDGKGLLIYDKSLRTYQHHQRNLSSTVNCIQIVKDTIVWLGSNEGLFKAVLSKKNGFRVVLKLTTYDGLPSNEINDVKTYNQDVIIATNNGVSVFSDRLKQTHKLYPLYLSAILSDMKDTLYNGYERRVNLNLSKGCRDLYLRFSSNREKSNAFMGVTKFKLLRNGIVIQKWTPLYDNNIQFTNLEPGQYSLMVETSDQILKSKFITQAGFYIPPFYYEKTWVKVLGAMVLLLVVFLVFIKLLKKSKADSELKRKMAMAELDSLRNQMNPHFIFNALNAIQYFIFDNDQEKAGKFLSKFSVLIRKSLEFSKLNFISVQAEIDFIRDYMEMEKMRFANKFTYEINVSPDIDLVNSFIPPLLMQPLIENAIKHGFRDMKQDGLVTIKIWLEQKDVLGYSVLDNGTGILNNDSRDEGYKTSLSHTILKERFLLLKNHSKVNTNIGMNIQNFYFDNKFGTYIVLKLPLKYD